MHDAKMKQSLDPSISCNAAMLWPANIPTAEQALAALQQQSDAPESLRVEAQRFVILLSNSVRGALSNADTAWSDILRNAAVCCWRVEIARSSTPPKGPLDNSAAERLLADVDSVLAVLKAPDDMEPSLAADVDGIRAMLARTAVDFSEILQRVAKDHAQETAKASAQKFLLPRTSGAFRFDSSIAAKAAHLRKRSIFLGVAFCVSLGTAGLYHGWRYLGRRHNQAPAFAPGMEGTAGIANPRLNTQTLISLNNKHPIDPAQLQAFRATVEAQGKRLLELSPGQFVVMPKGMADEIERRRQASAMEKNSHEQRP